MSVECFACMYVHVCTHVHAANGGQKELDFLELKKV